LLGFSENFDSFATRDMGLIDSHLAIINGISEIKGMSFVRT